MVTIRRYKKEGMGYGRQKIWNFVAAVVGGLAVIGVVAWQYNGQQDTIDWEKVTDYPAKKAGEKKKVGEEKDILQLQKVRYPKKTDG